MGARSVLCTKPPFDLHTLEGSGGSDKFRIKIYDQSQGDAVIYDNNIGASDSADPTTIPAGGNIVIDK